MSLMNLGIKTSAVEPLFGSTVGSTNRKKKKTDGHMLMLINLKIKTLKEHMVMLRL